MPERRPWGTPRVFPPKLLRSRWPDHRCSTHRCAAPLTVATGLLCSPSDRSCPAMGPWRRRRQHPAHRPLAGARRRCGVWREPGRPVPGPSSTWRESWWRAWICCVRSAPIARQQPPPASGAGAGAVRPAPDGLKLLPVARLPWWLGAAQSLLPGRPQAPHQFLGCGPGTPPWPGSALLPAG